MTSRDDLIQALGSATNLEQQIALVAELDALDDSTRRTASAERSLDWANTVVGDTLTPVRTLDRHTASTDWLVEADTSGGENHHQAVIAEAALWFQGLDADVKADAEEYSEQARGFARRTAGRYGERAEEAEQSVLDYATFLNRSVLAASGLPQVDQLVDSQENPAETPLPLDAFPTFQDPIHPLNQGVSGTEQNSLAPGAEEALSGGGGGSGSGRPSEHDEGGEAVAQTPNPPRSAEASRRVAGMLERAKDATARKGHSMQWEAANGEDAWSGRCTGCGSSLAVTASGVVEGSTAHVQACNHRSHGSLGAPSVAISHRYNMNDFLAAEAVREAGGADPFVREPEPLKAEAASGLDQVQQTMDSQETPSPSSLPQDVMFPIDQPWPEETTGEGEAPEGKPSTTATRKTADTWQGGDAPASVPGGETPVGNTPATTPPKANGGAFDKGVAEGRADAAAGEAPSFADNSSKVTDYVRGYVHGFGEGQQPAAPGQDVPGSMGGDSGQAQNAAEVAQRTEKPLVMAKAASKMGMTVSAALVTADVSGDEEFHRGYRWARSWKPGEEIVATGSRGEEAGIYAGITDNPAAQSSWVSEHRKLAEQYPELEKRLSAHKRVTAHHRESNPDAITSFSGLYVQASSSLDLDTMSPTTSPDPQGATPSEGPGTIPPLRDAPGTPAAVGGPAPYNGVEPLGAPVVPDPLIQNGEVALPQSPDAVNVTGDSSLKGSAQTMAFRRRVQQAKLSLRQKGNS